MSETDVYENSMLCLHLFYVTIDLLVNFVTRCIINNFKHHKKLFKSPKTIKKFTSVQSYIQINVEKLYLAPITSSLSISSDTNSITINEVCESANHSAKGCGSSTFCINVILKSGWFFIERIKSYLVYEWIRHCCVRPFSSIRMIDFQHMKVAWKWNKGFQICNLLCLLSNCIITVIFSLINNINIMNFVLI